MPELARIVDTLKLPSGALASGSLTITPSDSFIAVDGTAISGGPFTVQIIDGIVDLRMAPTEDAEPAVTYRAEYVLFGAKYAETWSVGREADGPFTIAEVRQ